MKKDGQVVLSKRLQMLAEMVTPGNSVADVGCDHAFLSIYLVQKGISPHVLAMDVREGPLAAAREHVKDCGLDTYIGVRLSDGMEEMESGEAETLICAGMGGRLMERILRAQPEKAGSMKELILQPQSELREFRAFLRRTGFRILAENAVYEDGKYYFAMKAARAGGGAGPAAGGGALPVNPADLPWQDIFDEYGELLLKTGHPVVRQYLLYKRETAEGILERLEAGQSPRSMERIAEIRQELAEIDRALGWFRGLQDGMFGRP